MRKTNKKVLLSLSVLAAPFVAENLVEENVASANVTYNLSQNVNVYNNAQNAAKQVNSSKTYTSGTYYVYKEHNGMINISRTQGKPGAWINPATSTLVASTVETTTKSKTVSTTPVATPTQTTATKPVEQTSQVSKDQLQVTKTTDTYKLNNKVRVYNTAALAKSQKGAKSTYSSGNYFIFKEFNGMMNISRVAGRAGAWINPLENKVVQAKTGTNSVTAQKPTEVKVASTTSTPVATPEKNSNISKTEENTYVLKNKTNVYNNAIDAKNSTNSTTNYNQGTYYVYKTHNGMINISRTRGRAGAWINPLAGTQDLSKTSNPASTQKPENSSKEQDLKSSTEVVYYQQDDARWGKKIFGGGNMANTACVPVSLAMAISTLSMEVNPVEIANQLYKSGYYNRGGLGTAIAGVPGILSKYGLKYKTINTRAALKDELAKGSLVYANVDGQPFVRYGSHAMVVKGLDETGKLATVYNPLSRLGIKQYNVDTIWDRKSKAWGNLTLGSPMLVIYK